MKNRVTVTIAGQEYTLVAAEDVRYVQRVASHVDAKVQEVLDGAKVSMVDGAVLAADDLCVPFDDCVHRLCEQRLYILSVSGTVFH